MNYSNQTNENEKKVYGENEKYKRNDNQNIVYVYHVCGARVILLFLLSHRLYANKDSYDEACYTTCADSIVLVNNKHSRTAEQNKIIEAKEESKLSKYTNFPKKIKTDFLKEIFGFLFLNRSQRMGRE